MNKTETINQLSTNIRESLMITGLQFNKVIPQIYKDSKTGKEYPWRQLIAVDMMGDISKYTLHKDMNIPDLEILTPIIVYAEKDEYNKIKVVQIDTID